MTTLAVASGTAQSILGERNPSTIGDCFTGDYSLHVICMFIWPILWPCCAVHIITQMAFERATEQVLPLQEGMTRKGGVNRLPSRVTGSPLPPASMKRNA